MLEYLSSGTLADRPGLTVFDGAVRHPDGSLIVQGNVAQRLDRMIEQKTDCVVCMSGGPGSGKRFQIEHLLSRWKRRGVFADLEGSEWEQQAQQAALAARLLEADLCLYHLDGRDEADGLVPAGQQKMDALCRLEMGNGRLFLLSRLPVRAQVHRLTVEIELEALTESERLEMFRACLQDVTLSDEVTEEELAAKFHFSPQQIRLANRYTYRQQGCPDLTGKPCWTVQRCMPPAISRWCTSWENWRIACRPPTHGRTLCCLRHRSG